MASNSGRRLSSSDLRRSSQYRTGYGDSFLDQGSGRSYQTRQTYQNNYASGLEEDRPRATSSRRVRSSTQASSNRRAGGASSAMRGGLLGGRDPRQANYIRKVRLLTGAVLLAILAVAAYLVVANSGIFAIKSIVATPTTHISSETISSLAAVPEGSTLFNINEAEIAARIKTNPWVQDVKVTRTLPSQLNIEVTERTVAAIVMLSNGLDAWRLSTDSYWIEAVSMQTGSTAALPLDQAMAAAQSDGVVLIRDVPATVSPTAGEHTTSEVIEAVLSYIEELPEALSSQVLYYKASGIQAISAILQGGIEVALGSPSSDIAWKGEVALRILQSNAGQISYVNVRTPDTPSWRGLDAQTSEVTEAGDTTEDAADAAGENTAAAA